jgi:hypothetical protein
MAELQPTQPIQKIKLEELQKKYVELESQIGKLQKMDYHQGMDYLSNLKGLATASKEFIESMSPSTRFYLAGLPNTRRTLIIVDLDGGKLAELSISDEGGIMNVRRAVARHAEIPEHEPSGAKGYGPYSREQIYAAMETAVKKTFEWFKNMRVSPRKLWFGPNIFDGCYYWRHGVKWEKGKTYGTYGVGFPDVLEKQKEEAKILGIPAPFPEEQNLLNLINLKATLQSANKAGKICIVKHFPGAPDLTLELTEQNIVSYPHSLAEMKKGYLKPFIDSMKSGLTPHGVMVGHAMYPVAEEELRKQYPNFENFGIKNLPASFSPYFIEFLKTELGFNGLIIGDWFNMKSINKFLSESRKNLPIELKGLSNNALIVILAVNAGLNFIPGLLDSYYEGDEIKYQKISREDVAQIKGYYEKNINFKNKFDTLIKETISLESKLFNIPELKQISVDELSFEQKLDILTGGAVGMEFTEKGGIIYKGEGSGILQKLVYTLSDWADIWNRGGVITLKFRKEVVESLSGKKFPDITEYKKADGKTDLDWIRALFKNSEFKKIYESIPWDGPDMKNLYNEVYKKVIS